MNSLFTLENLLKVPAKPGLLFREDFRYKVERMEKPRLITSK